MTEKQHAVVGYAFTHKKDALLLIRKKRPRSQAGKLNGPGGKVEPGETHIEAMIREFREETGIVTSAEQWICFAELEAPGWQISFFKTLLPLDDLRAAVQAPALTDEQLELWSLVGVFDQELLRNARWMIPFCLDDSPYEFPIKVKELKE